MTDYESTYKNLKDTDSIAYLKPASLEHFLNHEIKSSFTIDWNQKLTILELGCGTGSLFEEGYESHHIIAIDISQTAINYAKQNNVNNIIFKEPIH